MMNSPKDSLQPLSITVLCCSMNPESKSTSLAKELIHKISLGDVLNVNTIMLLDLPPIYCNGGELEAYPDAWQNAAQTVRTSDAVIIAHPVHNYGASGATFNALEIIGEALKDKPVLILSAAGSIRSHLASSSLMHALFFEFGCQLYPKTLQIAGDDTLASLGERIDELSEGFQQFCKKNKSSPEN